jgi:hypothetical protein
VDPGAEQDGDGTDTPFIYLRIGLGKDELVVRIKVVLRLKMVLT